MSARGKGELKLILAGGEVTLKPDFEAITQVEDETGMGLGYLFDRMAKGNVGFKNVTACIYAGLLGSGYQETFTTGNRSVTRALTFVEVGQRVKRTGLMKCARVAGLFLAECMRSEMPDPEAAAKGEKGAPEGEPQGAA